MDLPGGHPHVERLPGDVIEHTEALEEAMHATVEGILTNPVDLAIPSYLIAVVHPVLRAPLAELKSGGMRFFSSVNHGYSAEGDPVRDSKFCSSLFVMLTEQLHRMFGGEDAYNREMFRAKVAQQQHWQAQRDWMAKAEHERGCDGCDSCDGEESAAPCKTDDRECDDAMSSSRAGRLVTASPAAGSPTESQSLDDAEML